MSPKTLDLIGTVCGSALAVISMLYAANAISPKQAAWAAAPVLFTQGLVIKKVIKNKLPGMDF